MFYSVSIRALNSFTPREPGVWSEPRTFHNPQEASSQPPGYNPESSHMTLQQPHSHAHYSGSLPHTKRAPPPPPPWASPLCLQLLSHPDEASQHHKCFVASNASRSRGERRVSAWRFVWSQRGSNDSCLLQSARRLSEAGFLSKSEGLSRLHPSTRLCSAFNYVLWERSSHAAGSLGLSAGTSGNLH